ncbi:hypothetical protein HMPREF1584_00258 [Gardnerella vaginalis JCP8481A]|nr:hypothetical protein HMPREF1584_00258 [Gardnerella vaginalis JCP8481A]
MTELETNCNSNKTAFAAKLACKRARKRARVCGHTCAVSPHFLGKT